jgi:translation initiation factor 2 alpha subunit (eIF-2alpha)
MSIDITKSVEASARRLFPNMSLDQVLVELLLERAQKNLIKYQTMARQFEAKYDQDFETFREMVLHSEPISEVEQDYFDWELAVTGIADMKEEIERLKSLG